MCRQGLSLLQLFFHCRTACGSQRPMRAGGSRLSGKRCWQVRMSTWGTSTVPPPVRGEALPQLLPELSRAPRNPQPLSSLVLSSPTWSAPEAVQVGGPTQRSSNLHLSASLVY